MAYAQYTAIIIEPRNHPALEFVLNNFLENLNDEWNFIIFHGINNKNNLIDIINNKFEKHISRIKLINLNIDNLTYREYSNILKTESFYDFIPTETFLIFQTDTMILKKYRHHIDFFLNYDYVGAPWDYHRDIGPPGNSIWVPAKAVGNGGLSLRKKSKMLEILRNRKKFSPVYESDGNEDVFFSLVHTENENFLYKPSFDEAKLFAMETVFSEQGSFGVHKPWIFLDIEKLKEVDEDILVLKNLNDKNT